MSDDILNLIAEARRRQEVAEQERDQWKRRLRAERARLKSIIQLIRRHPITPPNVDEHGRVDWQQLERIVEEAADIFCDRYAIFREDDDTSLTHEQARILLANQLADMIEAAVKKAKS
jgi:hypothetical protein